MEARERERTGIPSLKVRFNNVFGFYIEVSKANLAAVPEDYDRKQTLVNAEAERLESELSMIRYIAWAIPSIGFIGTVRGIGQALTLAYRAVEGDISGVTESLGVAFNSTFFALLVSIFIMFLVHQLQLLQERLVFETSDYCDERLIRRLQGD